MIVARFVAVLKRRLSRQESLDWDKEKAMRGRDRGGLAWFDRVVLRLWFGEERESLSVFAVRAFFIAFLPFAGWLLLPIVFVGFGGDRWVGWALISILATFAYLGVVVWRVLRNVK